MSKNKHKFFTFAALMTGATVAVHFINHTIAAAAQLKQMLHISNDNYFEWRLLRLKFQFFFHRRI